MTRLEMYLMQTYIDNATAMVSRNIYGDYVVSTTEGTITYHKKQDMLLDMLYTLTQWAGLEGDGVEDLYKEIEHIYKETA